ncbi:hypothetical protein A8C56_07770 [Niabella ginsenosidivorans]|uniref:HTH luxR-type domain-containing protein n=1 Tax=Niabella ginsenosidivorans TaxID=1176587 RepID=A0A1A9I1F2_9BACT|nr:hypothetical protein A8C56_07770 [Niabella ginsenosidivorans]
MYGVVIKEAAYLLGLSTHTVKSYYKNIIKKFNVNRTADLIVFAIKMDSIASQNNREPFNHNFICSAGCRTCR